MVMHLSYSTCQRLPPPYLPSQTGIIDMQTQARPATIIALPPIPQRVLLMALTAAATYVIPCNNTNTTRITI